MPGRPRIGTRRATGPRSAFTEQYIIDVSSLTDAQAADLCAHLGDEGFVTFVNALLVIEQRMTLELAFDGVLG